MIIFIKNLTTPIADVSNFTINTLNGTSLLTWDLAPDFDVKTNGSVLFRYSNNGTNWENAIKLQTVASGQSTSVYLPLLVCTYLAKFADSQGNQSVNAALVVVDKITNIVNMNLVAKFDQEPYFLGVKTNMVVAGSYNLQFDAINGDLYRFGSYYFDAYIDINSVKTARVIINMSSSTQNESDFIDSRTELIDAWDTIDNPPANVTVETFISTTDDDPAGSPIWSPWGKFTIADYTARAFKFKIEVSAQNLNHQIHISELSASVELPDRSETQRNLTSGITTKTITYAHPFYLSPVVTVTPVNMMTGDYFTILGENFLKFDIKFYDSSDVAISRIFSYNATGY